VPPQRFSAAVCRELRALAAEAAAMADIQAATARLASGVSRILGVHASVASPVSPGTAGLVSLPPVAPVEQMEPVSALTVRDPADSRWSLGSHAGLEWILQLPGRWDHPRARACLDEFSRLAAGSLQAPALRQHAARTEAIVAAAYTFSRRLTKITSAPPLHQFIVTEVAEIVGARLGALALYTEDEGTLHVAATHGYPQVLVEHVRTQPGEGVIGQVFESRRPMLVRDVHDVPGLRTRRPRYRTPSFLAVPLLDNGGALGVVCLADRRDGRPFEPADLTAVRALAAPAALALVNARLARQTRELAHAASIDPLTGLFNRRYFHTRIEEEMERARRHGLDLALLLADVDNFKPINDQLGHLAGDYLLRQIADVLKRSVRVFDVCTRFGGEEFAILMPGSNAGNALAVAERIRARVEGAARDEGPLPPHVRITISLGLAMVSSETTSQELIARADRALYRAKAEGKNRVWMDQ
jgi:diguanylate cyclase (GGDEF)-like protein